MIAESCNELNLQLAISLGGRQDPDAFDDLPGNPVVVKHAPQLELVKMAEIVITHGGLNTALETLLEGKPMVVIPLAFDQPAVAARLAWLKVAEVLPVKGLSAKLLGVTLSNILNDASYREAAKEVQAAIHSVNGLESAVDVIEASMENTYKDETPMRVGEAQ